MSVSNEHWCLPLRPSSFKGFPITTPDTKEFVATQHDEGVQPTFREEQNRETQGYKSVGSGCECLTTAVCMQEEAVEPMVPVPADTAVLCSAVVWRVLCRAPAGPWSCRWQVLHMSRGVSWVCGETQEVFYLPPPTVMMIDSGELNSHYSEAAPAHHHCTTCHMNTCFQHSHFAFNERINRPVNLFKFWA